MINIRKEGILLQKTAQEFENKAVLNPAAIRDGDFVHLFYRASNDKDVSSIGYCKLNGPLSVLERHRFPVLVPQFDYESDGVEDPRIVLIDGIYYLTYTAFDGINALGAIATSKDLVHFEKQGILVSKTTFEEFSQFASTQSNIRDAYFRYNVNERISEKIGKKQFLWDKNLVFFPRKIYGEFYALHRIRPDIQIIIFYDFKELNYQYWHNYFNHFEEHILLQPKHDHEVSFVGCGCPPIETKLGWLLIYHGVRETIHGYVYSACAALLDLENPKKEIARLPYPLLEPENNPTIIAPYNRVCFPTGAVVFEDTLYIYYGDADIQIGCVSLDLPELLTELLQNTATYEK